MTTIFSPFDFFYCCSNLSSNILRRSRGVRAKHFCLNVEEKSGSVYFKVFSEGHLHEFFAEIKNDKVTILDLNYDCMKTNGYASVYENELEKCEQFVYFLSSCLYWPDAAKEAKGFLTDPTSQKNSWLKSTKIMI